MLYSICKVEQLCFLIVKIYVTYYYFRIINPYNWGLIIKKYYMEGELTMFKRLSCLALAVLMVASLTACKNGEDQGSEYYVEEEVVVQGEDGTTSTVKDNTSKQNTNNTSTDKGGNTSNGGANSSGFKNKGNAEKMKDELDFKGKTITLMREWDPYPNGRNAAWDNFNSHLAKTEKRFNVKIEEKKWKATLANEMLSGVKPEGHLYLVGATGGGNVYDMATKGYLADLNSAMKETGITMKEDVYSEFNTGINNLNGKQWSIGVGFSRIKSAIIYNKKILAAAGYKRTVNTDTSVQGYIDSNKWTWKKMTEMAKKVTKKNSSGEVTTWGIGIGQAGIEGMIISNGGHLVFPNSKGKFVSTMNTENVKEALKQVYDWYHVDKVASSFSSGQWTSMGKAFTEKKIAFVFGGHNEASTPSSTMQADDYGIAYLPMGPRAKKYHAYMTYEYCYVVPAAYKNMTTELLLLADELHQWPAGVDTRDNEFRDEWTRYFLSNDQYQMWYNMHYSKKINRTWEASAIIGGSADFGKLISGAQTAAVWVDTNHKAVNKRIADISKKYTYTGPLK